MSRSRVLVHVGLGNGYKLLPWIALLLVSATLAYGINIAVAGVPSAGDQQPGIQIWTSDPTTCAGSSHALMEVGLDPWIVAESRAIACRSEAPW